MKQQTTLLASLDTRVLKLYLLIRGRFLIWDTLARGYIFLDFCSYRPIISAYGAPFRCFLLQACLPESRRFPQKGRICVQSRRLLATCRDTAQSLQRRISGLFGMTAGVECAHGLSGMSSHGCGGLNRRVELYVGTRSRVIRILKQRPRLGPRG